MGKFGTTELLVILGIALLIFGPKKLPELGKSIGETIKEFKRSMNTNDPGPVDHNPPKDNTPDDKQDQE